MDREIIVAKYIAMLEEDPFETFPKLLKAIIRKAEYECLPHFSDFNMPNSGMSSPPPSNYALFYVIPTRTIQFKCTEMSTFQVI